MAKEAAERLSMLEEVLAEYIIQNGRSERQLRREIASLSDEMKEFKDEMRQSREQSSIEMKEFKDEMRQSREQSSVEMKEFKDEMRQSHKEMNKKWGDLANKMGTLVEDIIAPAVRPAIREYFKEEPTFFTVRTRKSVKELGLKGEFDVIAASDSYVYLVETKSSPEKKHLEQFNTNIERFRKLFPEFQHLPLIPIFSSLRFEEDFIKLASKKDIYLLAYREWEYMDILNFDNVTLPSL